MFSFWISFQTPTEDSFVLVFRTTFRPIKSLTNYIFPSFLLFGDKDDDKSEKVFFKWLMFSGVYEHDQRNNKRLYLLGKFSWLFRVGNFLWLLQFPKVILLRFLDIAGSLNFNLFLASRSKVLIFSKLSSFLFHPLVRSSPNSHLKKHHRERCLYDSNIIYFIRILWLFRLMQKVMLKLEIGSLLACRR